MTIGIEAERANQVEKTGVEHYAKQLILHLSFIDQKNQYTLYLRTKPQDWFLKLPKNFTVKIMPFPKFWTQLRISWEMLRHPVDVLFIPASALPLIHPKKSVVTIHDVAWIQYPEAFTWWMRYFLRLSTWYAVKTAGQVIAISQATKDDLVKFYRLDPDKIAVVPHGYEKANHNFDLASLSPEIRSRLPEKYIFFISTLQPRKNVSGLIDAFAQLKREYPELPHKLVIAGRQGWKFEPILRKIKDNKDTVVYLGHVGDGDRWPLYHHADLFVHPSFYEGFGMWILEAFECGVAAAVSNISSLPEVGGEAALYFDPHNPDSIKKTIKDALFDKSLRDRLVVLGRARLPLFGWDRCARETLAVFEQAS
jgi:glycosyltransferase involved in cell wall biosynthesis